MRGRTQRWRTIQAAARSRSRRASFKVSLFV
jgi:hypothetical protein